MSAPAGVVITTAAAELLARLQDRHGPVMFHQSGGCCDGSSPMCYPRGDFLIGDRDVLLGVLDVGDDGVPVWISGPQYQALSGRSAPSWSSTWCRGAAADSVWRRRRECDSSAAAGSSPTPRRRCYRPWPVITGATYERGERPSIRGQVVAQDKGAAPGTCPAPSR